MVTVTCVYVNGIGKILQQKFNDLSAYANWQQKVKPKNLGVFPRDSQKLNRNKISKIIYRECKVSVKQNALLNSIHIVLRSISLWES